MADFKKVLVVTLSEAIPELEGKIQAGAVDEKTPAPFATFTIPEEKPIQTLSGVAGYETLFEVSVYDSRFAGADALKKAVVCILDLLRINGKICRYRSSQTDYFPQYDLHSVTLTFRII